MYLKSTNKIFCLLSAMMFTVWKNYRRIAIWSDSKSTKLQFVLEKENDVDRDFIADTLAEYEEETYKAVNYRYYDDISLEVLVTANTLPALDSDWHIVYQRLEFLPIYRREKAFRETFELSHQKIVNNDGDFKRKYRTSDNANEFEKHAVFLNRAFCGIVNWNFRCIGLGWDDGYSLIRIVMESENAEDIEIIKYGVSRYIKQLDVKGTVIDVEIFVDSENLPDHSDRQDLIWFWTHTHRWFFEDMKEKWEPLPYFNGKTDYYRFFEGIDEMLRLSKITELTVTAPLSLENAVREKWYRRNKTGEIWRLVAPIDDNDIGGQFTKVTGGVSGIQ